MGGTMLWEMAKGVRALDVWAGLGSYHRSPCCLFLLTGWAACTAQAPSPLGG